MLQSIHEYFGDKTNHYNRLSSIVPLNIECFRHALSCGTDYSKKICHKLTGTVFTTHSHFGILHTPNAL